MEPRPRLRRFAHIPLAHTVTLAALSQVKMNMGFVVTIGAGPEHSRKAMARALAQVIAKRLRHCHVGEANGAAIGQHTITRAVKSRTTRVSGWLREILSVTVHGN